MTRHRLRRRAWPAEAKDVPEPDGAELAEQPRAQQVALGSGNPGWGVLTSSRTGREETKMQTYKLAAKIGEARDLHLAQLPFPPGEEVEVVVRYRAAPRPDDPYPLRGLPYSYERPTDPVAEDDWELLK